MVPSALHYAWMLATHGYTVDWSSQPVRLPRAWFADNRLTLPGYRRPVHGLLPPGPLPGLPCYPFFPVLFQLCNTGSRRTLPCTTWTACGCQVAPFHTRLFRCLPPGLTILQLLLTDYPTWVTDLAAR